MLLHDSYEPRLIIKLCFNKILIKNMLFWLFFSNHIFLIIIYLYMIYMKTSCHQTSTYLWSWRWFLHSLKTERSDSDSFNSISAVKFDHILILKKMNQLCSKLSNIQSLQTSIKMNVCMHSCQQFNKKSIRILITIIIKI